MSIEVLVAGGTGRIGAPVVLRLLARGHTVRALTREPDTAEVPAGAKAIRGDFDDPDSIVAAMDGVDAVIVSGTAHRVGPRGETRHGRNVADAAARAGLAHLVYISGAGADTATGVPILEGKRAVEQRIREAGVPATILAPVYFMENAFNPWNVPALRELRFPLPFARSLQQVAIEDVAAFSVLAVEQPDRLLGRRIELASDELTGVEATERLTRVTGREYQFLQVPLEQLPPPVRPLFAWLCRVGFQVDLPTLHRDHPEIDWHSLERWSSQQSWP
jgi:uncharacterized protein YbjT (DUF2867 family)